MDRVRTIGALVALTGLAGGAALGAAPTAAAGPIDVCAYGKSSRDLNGDGFDDAAVGDPYATVNGKVQAGSVTVLFGDADGRIGEGVRRVLTQADLGETPEAGDRFGWSVTVADLAASNGCAGILVSSPGEDLGAATDAGIVQLGFYGRDAEGGPAGVTGRVLTQAAAHGTPETGDQFGYAISVLGYTSDDPLRIAVGAPGEDVGSIDSAGVVDLIDVNSSTTRNREVGQGSSPEQGVVIPGAPQPGDRFGATLASGRLDLGTPLSGELGVVVGAPGDQVAGADNAGSVTVLKEQLDAATLITQSSPGVPGTAATGNQFGFSLALGPRLGTIPRSLAVGAPGEDVRGVVDAGSVILLTNRDQTFVTRAQLTQGTVAVGGGPEKGDRFGYALAFDPDNDLGIGVPYEDLGRSVDAGLAQFVRVPGEEFELERQPSLSEDSSGTPGVVSASNRFAQEISALDGAREDLWAVTSPYQDLGSVYLVSNGYYSDAGGHQVDLPPRAWLPGSTGIPAAGANRFGWSVG